MLKVEGQESHLYIYDHPKRTKPKGLIDLSCAYMYSVHESLFDKRSVFQLVERALPCLATTTYLAAETAGELEDWCSALKTLCVPQMVRSPKVAKLREVRTLHLTISEAHRLPLKLVPNPYCVISFNNVRVAKTKVKVGPDPVYDEEFELDDIPPDVITVTVTVWNKGKRSKDTEVAEFTLELAGLRNSAEVEDWHQLSGVTPIGEWGSLRLRTRFLHDLIMPQDEYSPLKELVLFPRLDVVVTLADICHTDRVPLASSLLRIFRYNAFEFF